MNRSVHPKNAGKKSRTVLAAVSFIMIPILGAIDYYTGSEIGFSIFYLLPIVLITWISAWRAGLLAAVTSTITWLWAELQWQPSYAYQFIPYWNGLIRLGFFVIIVFLLSRLRSFNQELELTVAERTNELRERETLFRTIFEQAAVGIVQFRAADNQWVQFNRRYLELLGFTEAELREHTILDITHPEDREADILLRQKAMAGEMDSYNRDERHLRKDGSQIWVNVSVSLMRDDSGAPDYFISIVRNVTDRKQAEERTLSIVESSPNAIVLVENCQA